MSLTTTLTLPHLPHTSLLIILFTNVQNSAFLRQQLLAGNTAFEYAFLDASVLLSRNHVFAACVRAVADSQGGKSEGDEGGGGKGLKTRNVHSEIVFDLSPTMNIAESFRRFGIQDSTQHIVAIKVLPKDSPTISQDSPPSPKNSDTVAAHLFANVEGTAVAFTDEVLMTLRDEARIRKIYRLEAPKKGESGDLGREAEAFVLGSMALKGS